MKEKTLWWFCATAIVLGIIIIVANLTGTDDQIIRLFE